MHACGKNEMRARGVLQFPTRPATTYAAAGATAAPLAGDALEGDVDEWDRRLLGEDARAGRLARAGRALEEYRLRAVPRP